MSDKNKFYFSCALPDNQDLSISFEAVTLTEIANSFKLFLNGCGYSVDNVEFSNNEFDITHSSKY